MALVLAVLAANLVGLPAGLRRRRGLLVALGVAALGLLFIPAATRAPLLRLLRGGYALLIDLRALPEQEAWRGTTRSAQGGLYYFGGYKKALLQSMPWLVLGLAVLRRWLRGEGRDGVAPVLLLVPGLLLAAYAYGGWHGGVCLNLRYFLPVLPFAALLVAPVIRSLAGVSRGAGWAAALALAATLGASLPLGPAPSEGLILGLPLVLAGALAAALALSWLPSLASARLPVVAAALLAAVTLGWSAAVSFGYDARLERRWRTLTWSMGAQAAALLPERALLIADWSDPWFGLVADRGVRLAAPVHDDAADLPALVAWHLGQGWPVFAALAPKNWELQRGLPFMAGYRVGALEPVGQVQVGRIEPMP